VLLEAVQLHICSVRARGMRNRWWEALMLGLHAAGYLTAVLLVLSPLKAAVVIVVQQALFGLYLGCSFATNHKGMPMLSADDQSDFLRRQVLTARNVRGGRLVDFALGGLNYQIEHHLFPACPDRTFATPRRWSRPSATGTACRTATPRGDLTGAPAAPDRSSSACAPASGRG
jgi:fatty acid desaturase